MNHDDGVGYPLTFYVPEYRRRTITMWRAIAARYRNETAVLGYDLLNEPITPYHDTDFLNSRLEPFYRELVEAIREVDPNHPIMLAGAQWSTNFDVFGPPFADNLGYTYHMFWAGPQRSSIQKYVNFGNRWQVPIFIGETGEPERRLEREVPHAERALRPRLELLDLQEPRHALHRRLHHQAGRLGRHRPVRQRAEEPVGHDGKAFARSRGGDAAPVHRQCPLRPHHHPRQLCRLARPHRDLPAPRRRRP
ncbi:glycoside hydrolase family 5 protein [Ancylobacter dichloromethanicus]